jgi:mannose-6-phosphate isomerase-like protein (cupin superfamily)
MAGRARAHAPIVVTRAGRRAWQSLPGRFRYTWIGRGRKFLTGLGVAKPGGGEDWHRHTDRVEETYYVLRGRGRIWWRTNGRTRRLDFRSGDCLYLPCGIENRFVNTGRGDLWLLFNITNARKMRE